MVVTTDATELAFHSTAVGHELRLREVRAAFIINFNDVVLEFHGKFIAIVNS